jgi:hypothetical protein
MEFEAQTDDPRVDADGHDADRVGHHRRVQRRQHRRRRVEVRVEHLHDVQCDMQGGYHIVGDNYVVSSAAGIPVSAVAQWCRAKHCVENVNNGVMSSQEQKVAPPTVSCDSEVCPANAVWSPDNRILFPTLLITLFFFTLMIDHL